MRQFLLPVAAGDPADPRSDICRGLVAASLFFLGFLGRAAFTHLDAAAYARGVLVVAGQRQSVQHRDGGVVDHIYVREGQHVRAGQLLLTLAASDVEAQERAFASRTIRLLAQRARLEAEQMGHGRVAAPTEFASLPAEDRSEAALALKLQQAELTARIAVLEARRGEFRERISQSGDQGRGLTEQASSAREQLRIVDQQITALTPLAEKGFVPQVRMRELERMRAELRGQGGQYSAGADQAQGAVRESRIQALEATSSFRERTGSELREVENSLGEILPQWEAARDRLRRTAIRAPATGVIVRLSIFTPGGVIAAGQKLMDVVPDHQPILIEAQVSPDDADDLAIGQRALIRFPGIHDRSLRTLEGRLTLLSADNLTDERTGRSYFLAEVRLPESQVAILRSARGHGFAVRPGMPVEVLVPLRPRTALNYALEPLLGSFWSSFREH